MKKLALSLIIIFISAFIAVVTLPAAKKMQVVDVMVCDVGLDSAKLSAKAKVSRKLLYSVSYCVCEGLDSSFKNEVTKGECGGEKSGVYACTCVGQGGY